VKKAVPEDGGDEAQVADVVNPKKKKKKATIDDSTARGSIVGSGA
jgi:hypothetical protein